MKKQNIMTIGIIIGIILFGFCVYESNTFFMSSTERLIANKVGTQ